MTFRGVSILAVLAALLVLGALGQSMAGLLLDGGWQVMAAAGVTALCALVLAVLSTQD